MDPNADTIIAPGTPPGRSAVAVVRLSGPGALDLVERRLTDARPLASLDGHTATHGWIRDEDACPLDEVVVTIFRAPRSYTGEDVAEISCHGNPVIVDRLVALFARDGARPAEPGEFTRRAFLNGRIDLAQAEAVASLIAARGDVATRNVLDQLGGAFSERVGNMRQALIAALSELEAHIDFPEQDLETFDAAPSTRRLESVASELRELYAAVRRGRPLHDLPVVVLTGAPNVGKSSLMNALLGRARAIVHDEPGTTRDLVDAEVEMGGLVVRLVDTAGLREASSEVEAEGVRRSEAELRSATVVLIVLDGSQGSRAAHEEEALATADDRAIVVANKRDLGERMAVPAGTLRVSATTGEGVDALRKAIRSKVTGEVTSGEMWVTSRRQERNVEAATESTAAALEHLSAGRLELVAEELRGAANALGEITGERVGADVLDAIFADFCIGK